MSSDDWRRYWLLRIALAAIVIAAGVRATPAAAAHVRSAAEHGPVPAAVALISDCRSGQSPPVCGAPPAVWAPSNRPVAFCSYGANSPAWLSAADFRRLLRDAAAAWNRAEAGTGIRYTGDCTGGIRWIEHNGRNEIGFDDERQVIPAADGAVGLTSPVISSLPPRNPTSRTIEEADIIVWNSMPAVPACLFSVLVHEMGHALGFGQSTSPNDIMYPSVADSPTGCTQGPSAEEVRVLLGLYGSDGAPTVSTSAAREVRAGDEVTLQATGTDPEGGPLTFEWEQASGPVVSLTASDGTARFQAPNGRGSLV